MKTRYSKAYNLATIARCLGASGGDWETAAAYAEQSMPWNEKVVTAMKSAIGASSLLDMQDDFSYNAAVEHFIEALRSVSVFDQMAPSMREVPLRTRLFAASGNAGIAGDAIAEGAYTPLSTTDITGAGLDPVKAIAMFAMTKEAFRLVSTVGLIERELVNGVSAATNRTFLAALALAAQSEASAGATVANVVTDLGKLLEHVSITGTSSLFMIVGPDTASHLSIKHTNGMLAFPDMSPNGGSICNIPTLVSDQLPSDSSGHRVMLVDADGIAFGDETIVLDRAEHASLQMADDPSAGAQNLVSLWQTGSIAIRATRHFGFEVVRPNAVALLTGVQW